MSEVRVKSEESCDCFRLPQWLNSALEQMWPFYDAAISASVKVRLPPQPTLAFVTRHTPCE